MNYNNILAGDIKNAKGYIPPLFYTAISIIFFILIFATGANAQFIKKETAATLYGNAVTVNATALDEFHEGFAIVRKGEDFGIINKYGNFLVPYGKYKFNKPRKFEIDNERCGFRNGMCAVRDPDSEAYGFIDLNGLLVIPCTLSDVSPFLKDGYAWAVQKDANGRDEQVYVDKKGGKYRLKNQSLFNHNREEAYYNSTGNGNEFYDKKGKLLFKTKKWFKDGYSEGLIRVDTTYELAGQKSGYMNLAGKLVIPYKFKGRLYEFSEGLAQYNTPTSDEFKYMYIDKTGTAVIKLRATQQFPDLFFNVAPFEKGYALGMSGGKYVLLDKTGAMFFISDRIEQNNPGFTSNYTRFEVANVNSLKREGNYIKFEADMQYDVPVTRVSGGIGAGQKYNTVEHMSAHGYGIADLTGKIIIPPVYSNISFPDPVSGLAKATYTIHLQDRNINLDGYASQSEIFAIIINNKP